MAPRTTGERDLLVASGGSWADRRTSRTARSGSRRSRTPYPSVCESVTAYTSPAPGAAQDPRGLLQHGAGSRDVVDDQDGATDGDPLVVRAHRATDRLLALTPAEPVELEIIRRVGSQRGEQEGKREVGLQCPGKLIGQAHHPPYVARGIWQGPRRRHRRYAGAGLLVHDKAQELPCEPEGSTIEWPDRQTT